MKTPGQIEDYLYFNGNCEEALTFYADVLGGEITGIMYFRDMPVNEQAALSEEFETQDNAVMNAVLRIGETTLMGSDDVSAETRAGGPVALNWSHSDRSEVESVWQAFLDAGAEVDMPLKEAFFAPLFGALTDPYGISWQIMQWTNEQS